MQSSHPMQSSSAAENHPEDKVRAPSAEPWDAPYFGGPVYFTYRPWLVTNMAAAMDGVIGRAPGEVTQWTRFPHFGGPIYDGYPPFSSATPVPDHMRSTFAASGPLLDALHPRFFGGHCCLTYEPNIPGFSIAPATPDTAFNGGAAEVPPTLHPTICVPDSRAGNTATRRGGWLARLVGRHR